MFSTLCNRTLVISNINKANIFAFNSLEIFTNHAKYTNTEPENYNRIDSYQDINVNDFCIIISFVYDHFE